MNAVDQHAGAAVAHAVVDADGTLLSADPAIAALHARAGGAEGGPLAVPQLATAVRLARRLGIIVARRMTVADEEADIELWVRAQPEGERVRIAASGWTEQPAWRPAVTPAFVSGDGAWRWETDGALRLTFVSLGGGFDAFALLGKPLTSLFGFDERSDGSMPILDALARRRPFRQQPAVLRPTGAAVMLDAEARPDASGAFAGLTGTARVVETPPEPLSSEFTGRLDKALRAPLARIVANADSINTQTDGPVSGEYAGYAADIANAGRHLMGLVDDLVDLQAIERPDFRPDAEPIDLADVARRAAGLLAVRADSAGVTIERLASQAAAPATGDFRRTLQIMMNLLTNALRYSVSGGRVMIDVRSVDGQAVVSVTDTGKGIASADQVRIFEKFERVDTSEVGGNGLGLFIARRLARAMGGDLTVASAPGEGASFTLSLPARQAARD
jgi:signal transduction histidine kinase